MKKESKSEAMIAAEKAEQEELIARNLQCTNQVPKKIMTDASYQVAVQFKKYALDARKAAESQRPNLQKLRSAWSLISGYYA